MSFFCLLRVAFSEHFIYMDSYNMTSFGFWFLSLHIIFFSLIHVIACFRILLLFCEWYFILWINHILSIHSVMDICVLSTFCLLWIILLWTFICKFLCGQRILCPLDRILKMALLGCIKNMFNFIWNHYVVFFIT